MKDDCSAGDKTPAWNVESLDNCPECGTRITGITTTGPGEHEIAPCGHAVGDLSTRKDLLADGGRAAAYPVNGDDRPAVSYGPTTGDRWRLWFSTAFEPVELLLDEAAMYELWTEVKDRPWPDRDDDRGPLQRQVVHLTNGADKATLQEAIAVLRGEAEVKDAAE